jgi:hypothetical protein
MANNEGKKIETKTEQQGKHTQPGENVTLLVGRRRSAGWHFVLCDRKI